MVVLAVAAAAGLAAAAVAIALGAGGGGGGGGSTAAQRPLTGVPPLVIDLPGAAVKGGDAAVLAAAQRRLPADDVRRQVAEIVAGDDAGHRLQAIAALHALPQDEPVVLMALGLAELWAGRAVDAQAALERASRLDPYGFYGTRADNLLFARSQVTGYPPWVTATAPKASIATLRARAQAAASQAGPWLALAAALERSDRVAAIAAAGHAVTIDPASSSAQVAAAVLSFRKERAMTTVQTLQNLLQRWPADPEIEFHLGLVYLWLRDGSDAAAHFRQAVADAPTGPYAAFAHAFARCIDNPGACATAGG